MRILLVAILMQSYFCCCFFQTPAHADMAGKRPDETSFLLSLEAKIAKLERKLSALEEEYHDEKIQMIEEYTSEISELRAKKKSASRFGWPLITDSTSDYKDKIKETMTEKEDVLTDLRTDFTKKKFSTEEDLKNALASTEDKVIKEKMSQIREETSSRESFETYNAAINLQKITQNKINALQADPTNYDLAEATYKSQLKLCSIVIRMNSAFKARIATKYIPEFNSIISRVDSFNRDLKNPDIDPIIIDSQTEKMALMKEKLLCGIDEIKEMRPVISNRIEKLKQFHKTVGLLKRSAGIAKDSSGLFHEMNEQITQIDIPMPEIIDYDLKDSDFQITKLSAR